ncbi:interleukin-12 subunit alpha [Betta splendens]|uniref:Interleukin-12 subunit alpha n=1 Tax=Betta splendens TaxID=158456 RepID=A0A6P7P343_BETSP|nr:interleukin-12 subunit alpha [Betta splendens]
MVNLNGHFTRCALLLLLLTTLNWRTSTAGPVLAPALSAEKCAQCSSLFGNLLINITTLLKSGDICYAIPSDAVLIHNAETLQACAPTVTQQSGCMMQRDSPFSESECMKNIMKDLSHYDAAIESYLTQPRRNAVNETELLRSTQEMIKSLMKHCSLDGGSGSSEWDAAPLWGNNTFDNRQVMCKMMKGFHIRAITINRAMGYISSGDHRK